MHQFRLLGLATLAVFALSWVVASAAFAENPEILSSLPSSFTGTSGEGSLRSVNGKSAIECKSDTLAGEFTTKAGAGKATVDFKECKSNGIACNSLGDPSGIILLDNATIQLVDIIVPKEVLTLGLLITVPGELHIECGASVLILVKGAAIGTISGVTSGSATKAATLTFAQKEGKQTVTACNLPKAICEGKTYTLEANFGKKLEVAGEESTESIAFPTAITVDF